ncbi:M4 family metallopeptidase [Winogradskyella bathintestinalis]|uniref:M4 family metallopeptidase n=1 Tax=Winogradskyella bathintestinalis TaxID=3035208 RepID=A0ABT7ZY06_9FLAO|nr:M4 family metallopeptidase [Winogradskyella bathintestinalis]MDN3493885.1 M4 family metallopeptidase [Winogradskyella bathintestinalis]
MKKNLLCIFTLLILGLTSSAQNLQKAIEDFKSITKATVTINVNSGIPEFIKFPLNEPLEVEGYTVLDKSMSFLDRFKNVFDIKILENTFHLDTIKTDQYDFKHVVLQQTHQGVPIFDGQLKFHFNSDGKITAINGNYIPYIKLKAIPNLSQEQAANIAIDTINNQDINYSSDQLIIKESALYVFQKGLVQGYRGSNYLVYRIEVTNENDVREFIFVDANNGQIIEQFTGIAHAIDRAVYEGNGSNIVWQEGDAFPGLLTIWQQNEVLASGHTYNFFKNAFDFVSFDGADATMLILNNVDDADFCPNASWNGVNINFCDGTATDDVIGHEWSHAYTEYTSGLIYSYQSGAINEAYSDIWGETIDLINNYEDEGEDFSIRTNCNSSDRWLIGEDASSFGGAIRDMWDPTCMGDPGKVMDIEYWCDAADSGGVHVNSGVPNRAYTLLVDGGNYNGYTINGIGFTKAAHIFWRAQSQYLTISSDFSTLADALVAAGNDLIGFNLEGLSTSEIAAGPSNEIITLQDLNQLVNTILAVELRTDPGCPNTSIILEALENELCDAAINNPIFFEDWESGLGNWTTEQVPVNSATWTSRDWVVGNGTNANRFGNIAYGEATAIGDCNTILENGIIRLISPVITIPNVSTSAFEMAFNHVISLENEWDGANIKYSLDGGEWTILPLAAFTENPYNDAELRESDNPLAGEPAFTGSDVGTYLAWGTSVLDLSTIGVVANSTIQFRFEVGTDGCNGIIGWALDEVMIYNCTTLSINEFALQNAIHVYPNPSKGEFTIQKMKSLDILEATIYDINGRQIKKMNLQDMSDSMTIDLSHMSSGMYFMSVASKESKFVIKLFKE